MTVRIKNKAYPAESYNMMLSLPSDDQEKMMKIMQMIIQMKQKNRLTHEQWVGCCLIIMQKFNYV